nr:zinc finger, CCHC-type, retrotransposon Gag domain protein [Tanacetum cinerariifolium]
MEKIFDVMGCKDAFKTRLVVYKFEGDALAWWKAYKQAKGGDVWLITNGNNRRLNVSGTSLEVSLLLLSPRFLVPLPFLEKD